jgi:sec-independent protein translocase protein TatB
MFDIGFSELVLIGILALLVLGPKRLPEVARTAGRWMAQLRRFVTNVKQDFDRELHGSELSELRKLKQELDDTRRAFADSGSRLAQNLADSDRPSGNKTKFPHPDDPVTAPVILPPPTPTRAKPKAKSKVRRPSATKKSARTHGRQASQRQRSEKRR